jgi:hypothetical protein
MRTRQNARCVHDRVLVQAVLTEAPFSAHLVKKRNEQHAHYRQIGELPHVHTHIHTPYTYYTCMLDKNHAQKAPLMLACFGARTSAAAGGESGGVSSSSDGRSIGGSLRSAGDE